MKSGTKHFWITGIQDYADEDIYLSSRGENSKITIKNYFLLQNCKTNLNQTWYRAALVTGFQVCAKGR